MAIWLDPCELLCESDGCEVKLSVPGSALSRLLLTIVLEALSMDFCVGLPWELLYTDDLCLIAETENVLIDRTNCWEDALKSKGLRVNTGKMKVMCLESKVCPRRNF